MQSYQSHFGFDRAPFRMAPDLDLVFWSDQHRRSADALERGLGESASILILTGAPGTGKTTLMRDFVEKSSPDIQMALVWHPILLTEGFYRTVLGAFGLQAEAGSDAANEAALAEHLAARPGAVARYVLLVDEAQSLPSETILRLMVLARSHERLSVMLAGQPGLLPLLDGLPIAPDGPKAHLSKLTRAETVDYVRHRMTQAAGSPEIFTPDAHLEIYERTHGVPRMVNSICERCLYAAAEQTFGVIDADFVASVAEETDQAGFMGAAPPRALRPGKRRTAGRKSGGAEGPPTEDPAPSPLRREDETSGRSSMQPDGVSGFALPGTAGNASARDETPDSAPRRRPSLSIRVAAAFGLGAAAGFGLAALAPVFPGGDTAGEGAVHDVAPAVSATRDPDAEARAAALEAFARTMPPDAEARFRLAVSLAGVDPEKAVVAYSHAAAHGHARAAYYLGQVFETGDGVPVDLVLARNWYRVAAEDLRGAEASLTGLPDPEQGPLAPPEPLVGRRIADGMAELSWASGEGADPAGYTIEFAGESSPETLGSDRQTVSATLVAVPPGAARWRVIATDPAGPQWVPSRWQPLADP